MMKPYVSLCIPTNGIVEWVKPVLESIYSQEVCLDEFEVVVTDNGNNVEFFNLATKYLNKYSNFVYKKTNAQGFLNQIDCFKLANGKLLKFVNHRMKLNQGTIEYLINFTKKYEDTKPVVYFSNGALNHIEYKEFCSFNDYIYNLGHYSSWSAGISFWKSDISLLDKIESFNSLFPHTDLLFIDRKNSKYIIDNKLLLTSVGNVDSSKKGSYNLFYAFAVEYLNLIFQLYQDKDITLSTFNHIKEENFKFIVSLHNEFVLRKKKCSYLLDNYKEYISKYYSYPKVLIFSMMLLMKSILSKIVRVITFKK